jgi:hypothetical protein
MPESGTSGSGRDRDGQPPGLLDRHYYREAYWVDIPPVGAFGWISPFALVRNRGFVLAGSLSYDAQQSRAPCAFSSAVGTFGWGKLLDSTESPYYARTATKVNTAMTEQRQEE